MAAAERAQLQSVIDDLYERFAEVVDAGRPGLDRSRILELADGRVYTARQALSVGLVDSIGYLQDAIARAEALAGIDESQVILYERGKRPNSNIYTQAGSAHLGSERQPVSPGFYYIWPAVLPR